jgi:regulator of sigma E protease
LQEGDRIVAVDDVAVGSFQELSWQLISYIGETVELPLAVEDSQQVQRNIRIPLERWLTDQEAPDPMKALGIQPRQLPIDAIVGQVIEGGAAAKAGLIAGDKIVSIISAETFIAVTDWRDWVGVVRDNPERLLDLLVERDGQEIAIQLVPVAKIIDEVTTIGYVGAGIDPSAIPEVPSDWITETKLGPIDSLVQATVKTQQLIVFTLESLWKMILGDLSVKNLSGPITIAKVADSSASNGLQAFIGFLALLSVSLGVLNLLPIPVLDGGHIMFYAIEAIRGRALSERTQIVAVQVGMLLLMSLMVIAFYNDISRL